jgi:hypothetical protein
VLPEELPKRPLAQGPLQVGATLPAVEPKNPLRQGPSHEALALPTAEPKRPAAQGVHDAAAPKENVPAGQGAHEATVVWPFVGWFVPAAQLRQAPGELGLTKVPEGHEGTQADAPCGL